MIKIWVNIIQCISLPKFLKICMTIESKNHTTGDVNSYVCRYKFISQCVYDAKHKMTVT